MEGQQIRTLKTMKLFLGLLPLNFTPPTF
jgi:hypothetical protein